MTTQSTVGSRMPKPLRLWPGIALGVLILVLRYVVPAIGHRVFEGDTALTVALFSFLGSILAGILILLWWLTFSRAPWVDRLLAVGLVALGFVLGPLVQDRSITTGAMGMLYPILVIPIVGLAFVAWAVLTERLSVGMRRATMAAAILLAFASLGLIRTGGFTAGMKHDFAWRWTATPEERLLAAEPEPVAAPPVAPTATPAAAAAPAPAPAPAPPTTAATPTPTATAPAATATMPAAPPAASSPAPAVVAMPRPEWPGFRGPERDGVVSGTRIATDWTATPPTALWKRAVGPGWSSFAVAGDRIYTQEQRGEDELVACYSASTGAPIWQHRDRARFWESNGGAGPRGTPLIHQGRVYALGATGIVNALDAGTGAVVWTRNAAGDTKAKTPMWGFSGSPIVVDDLLIVPTSGSLSAYDLATGAPRWNAPSKSEGYTSPQLVDIDGVRQVLFVNSAGVAGLSPSDGKVLWSSKWEGYPIVQPQVVAGGGVLFAVQEGQGLRRLAVSRGSGTWTASETWTSRGLKPYFNDFVVHKGHAYGFDSNIMSCIDLADGSRKWKGGRYGNGQLVLLADQDALLVLGEEGEIALVKATPDGFTELAKMPGLDGKTWNHPVVVGDRLLVRNSEQMAAFRLPR
jgi:outer membrane protein assembly factor BamB